MLVLSPFSLLSYYGLIPGLKSGTGVCKLISTYSYKRTLERRRRRGKKKEKKVHAGFAKSSFILLTCKEK